MVVVHALRQVLIKWESKNNHLETIAPSGPEESSPLACSISHICWIERCSLMALQNSSNSAAISAASFPLG